VITEAYMLHRQQHNQDCDDDDVFMVRLHLKQQQHQCQKKFSIIKSRFQNCFRNAEKICKWWQQILHFYSTSKQLWNLKLKWIRELFKLYLDFSNWCFRSTRDVNLALQSTHVAVDHPLQQMPCPRWHPPGVNFINILTQSFYARRS